MKVKTLDSQSTTTLDPWGDISWATSTDTSEDNEYTPQAEIVRSDDVIVLHFKAISEVHLNTVMLSIFPREIFDQLSNLSPSEELDETSASTIFYQHSTGIYEALKSVLIAGKSEFFEDGMESTFSRNLLEILGEYGNEAIRVFGEFITDTSVNSAVISEALRWIGYIENPVTHFERRRLLERALSHTSPNVRDGALLGLASMDDPNSILALELAFHREDVSELRKDMEQVIMQLEQTTTEKM